MRKNALIFMADKNECFENEDLCKAGQECVNLEGGHHCQCKKGFFRKGKECQKGKPLKKEPMICTLKGIARP